MAFVSNDNYISIPNGVLNVVSRDDGISNATCQNPFLASKTVKNFAPWRRVAISSMVGNGYSARAR